MGKSFLGTPTINDAKKPKQLRQKKVVQSESFGTTIKYRPVKVVECERGQKQTLLFEEKRHTFLLVFLKHT